MKPRSMTSGLAGLVLAAATAGAAQADSGSFGDWTVVCDNTRTCTALGFGDLDEMGSTGHIAIRREGVADAAPRARLVTAGQGEASLSLAIDGRVPEGLAGLPARNAPEDPERRVTDLTAEQTQALLAGLINGGSLAVREAGRPVLQVSLSGSSASLRFMDDRQKRAGTLTALVAKGAKPASAVPPPPPPPSLAAAPAARQVSLPSAVPQAIAARLNGCDEDIAELGLEPDVARLGQDRLFWAVACSRGAYNVVYRLFLTDGAGRAAEPLRLTYPSGEVAEEVMNVQYDAETRSLTNFDKARGLGDCGAITTWRWTGQSFVLAEQTLMPECRGVLPEAWPLSYRSR